MSAPEYRPLSDVDQAALNVSMAEHYGDDAFLLELAMAVQWHSASDHAADGSPFGGYLCNCERIARRAVNIGWRPSEPSTLNSTGDES